MSTKKIFIEEAFYEVTLFPGKYKSGEREKRIAEQIRHIKAHCKANGIELNTITIEENGKTERRKI